jgi:aspartate/methionine/tyrosine aminotransferase
VARADAVPPFHAMAMARRAAEREANGHRVLHLEVGQPSTPAPSAARQAVAAAIAAGDDLGYTNAAGLMSLRERIAGHYDEQYQVTVRPNDVMVVAGASAGFTLAFLACFTEGARVGVLEPGYPAYRNTLLALGMVPVPIAVDADTRWAPTPAMLDAAAPLDGLIVASPSNPTGTLLGADVLEALASHCAANDIRLIADEIYHGITFDRPATTILSTPSVASGSNRGVVVINSFSKYFSMTGWRLGWMVTPDDIRDGVERLQQNLYICAPHISQIAGRAAMDCRDELDGHVRRYAANRRLLLQGLHAAGVTHVADADGAFYVYADMSHVVDGMPGGTMTLTSRWLTELDLAATPGRDFDLTHGDRFVRFSYAGSTDDIAVACDRLQGWRA